MKTALFQKGVIVRYNPYEISFSVLISIHLYTHSSTALHSMTDKYRSAIYTFNKNDGQQVQEIIDNLQKEFEQPIITKVLPFYDFT